MSASMRQPLNGIPKYKMAQQALKNLEGTLVGQSNVSFTYFANGTDKFNATTTKNIDRLNELLIDLDGTLGQYCETNNWYQINGLPIYIHAKTKFPK